MNFNDFKAQTDGVLNTSDTSQKTTDNTQNNCNKSEDMIKFNAPKDQSAIIKVIGVGGGGSNAVNHMYKLGIKDVDFVICNTDAQALANSPVPLKIQLGYSLTEGRGAGSLPEVGKNSAIENIDDIQAVLEKNTKMLFITAGMGGGTGTGAAPIIAAKAKELGILTVAIVTIPFGFEGRKRALQAKEGIKELRNNVDSLLIINNDKLRELYGNLELSKAFSEADSILTTAAKGIAEIITMPGYVNVDFEDVRTVMKDSGVAIMGAATAEGEDRAIMAVKTALESPLLNDNNIKGASDMLLYISSGDKEVLMDEISEITDYIQMEAGDTAEVIWGNGYDASLGNKISVTIIATGFEGSNGIDYLPMNDKIKKERLIPIKHTLEEQISLEDKTSLDENTKSELDFQVSTKNETLMPEMVEETKTVHYDKPIEEKKVIEKTPEGFTLFVDNQPKTKQSETSTGFLKQNSAVLSNTTLPPVNAVKEIKSEGNNTTEINKTEQTNKLDKNRQLLLKDLSIRLKDPSAITQMETEPAYKRKQVALEDVPHSSESHVSNYTLSLDENGDNKPQLKPNNSFLHEKPD